MMNTGKKIDPRSQWAEKLKQKVGMNKAAVAMANKNARTIWAVLTKGIQYDPHFKPVVLKAKPKHRGAAKGSPPAMR